MQISKEPNTNDDVDQFPLMSHAHNELHCSKYAYQLKWLSLSFFLFGGVFYIISATVDVLIKNNDTEMDTSEMLLYATVQTLSGFFYFMTGVTDLYICAFNKKILSENSHTISSSLPSSLPPLSSSSGCKLHQDEVVASLLTIAGGLEMASGLFSSNPRLSYPLGLVSVHFYFFEASIALFGPVCCYKCFYVDDIHESITASAHRFFVVYFLDKCGDCLFFTGSVIDLACGYSDYSPSSYGNNELPYWALASSVLWTVSAMFYIAGACIFVNKQEKLMNNTDIISINKEIELI